MSTPEDWLKKKTEPIVREELSRSRSDPWDDSPGNYPFHRDNARRMEDETLLRNMPTTIATGSWAEAMRDECLERGLIPPSDDEIRARIRRTNT